VTAASVCLRSNSQEKQARERAYWVRHSSARTVAGRLLATNPWGWDPARAPCPCPALKTIDDGQIDPDARRRPLSTALCSPARRHACSCSDERHAGVTRSGHRPPRCMGGGRDDRHAAAVSRAGNGDGSERRRASARMERREECGSPPARPPLFSLVVSPP
jgi:hypothetical protein